MTGDPSSVLRGLKIGASPEDHQMQSWSGTKKLHGIPATVPDALLDSSLTSDTLPICRKGAGMLGRSLVKTIVALGIVSQTVSISGADTYPLPAPVYLSGTANATITINYSTAPPDGSTASCSLALISNDPRGPSDANSASVPISGSTAVCPVTVNYRWRLTNPAADTMTIAYSVQGPTQSSSGVVNIIPMPADGYIANMVFTVNQ